MFGASRLHREHGVLAKPELLLFASVLEFELDRPPLIQKPKTS